MHWIVYIPIDLQGGVKKICLLCTWVSSHGLYSIHLTRELMLMLPRHQGCNKGILCHFYFLPRTQQLGKCFILFGIHHSSWHVLST